MIIPSIVRNARILLLTRLENAIKDQNEYEKKLVECQKKIEELKNEHHALDVKHETLESERELLSKSDAAMLKQREVKLSEELETHRRNLNEKEKEEYRKQLAENERQIEYLKREQYMARREADRLRLRMESGEIQDRWEPNDRASISLLNGDKSSFSALTIKRLKRLGYLDDDGNINEKRIIDELANRK